LCKHCEGGGREGEKEGRIEGGREGERREGGMEGGRYGVRDVWSEGWRGRDGERGEGGRNEVNVPIIDIRRLPVPLISSHLS